VPTHLWHQGSATPRSLSDFATGNAHNRGRETPSLDAELLLCNHIFCIVTLPGQRASGPEIWRRTLAMSAGELQFAGHKATQALHSVTAAPRERAPDRAPRQRRARAVHHGRDGAQHGPSYGGLHLAPPGRARPASGCGHGAAPCSVVGCHRCRASKLRK
jgi:hypothetical protein